MRNAILVVTAALLFPMVAHAEFATPRDTPEVRASTFVKKTKIEHAPSRVAVATPRLTVDEVLQKVNTVYMSGLQRCYRKSLAYDPTISGKVMLAFQVGDDGSVQSNVPVATKFDECLSRIVGNWRFSIPATAKDSSFKISLMLASN